MKTTHIMVINFVSASAFKTSTGEGVVEAEENPKGLPVIGFEHAVHLLENSSPKHSAQYGLSSREVNLQKRRHFDLGCHLKVRFLQFKPSCFFTGLIYMKDQLLR